MKFILAATVALFVGQVSAETYKFKITKLEPAKSFYRESPKNAAIGSEVKTFFAGSDLYKVRRDQWIFLVIEEKTGHLKGVGMEFQDGYDYKHIPANKIIDRPGGRFVEYESKKSSDHKEIQKQFQKFMTDNKLKLRGEVYYLLIPAIKVPDEDISQTFVPIE